MAKGTGAEGLQIVVELAADPADLGLGHPGEDAPRAWTRSSTLRVETPWT